MKMADELDKRDENILLEMDISGSCVPQFSEDIERCSRLARLGYARTEQITPQPDLPPVQLYRITSKGRGLLGTSR